MIIFNNLGHGTFAPFDVVTNVNSCDRTGWPALPHELVKQFNGSWVLREFMDPEPPQDYQRYISEKMARGPLRREPVGDEWFLEVNEVTVNDL